MTVTLKEKSVVCIVLVLLSVPGFCENLLNNPGFETPECTYGSWPRGPFDSWQGDYSWIVEAQKGITPYDGSHMLRFKGTGLYGPGRCRYASQVPQIVDLRGFTDLISTGNAIAKASMYYNRVDGDCQTDTRFYTVVMCWKGDPCDVSFRHLCRNPDKLLSEWQSIDTDSDPQTWQENAFSFTIPSETDYAVFWAVAVENVRNDCRCEFDGHYADLGSFCIIPEPATIVLLGLGCVGLFRRK